MLMTFSSRSLRLQLGMRLRGERREGGGRVDLCARFLEEGEWNE